MASVRQPGVSTAARPGRGWQNAAAYLRDPLGYMESLRRSSGDVAFVPFPGGHSFVFVSDPALIRRLLVDEGSAFVKGRALRAARRLLGDGLLTSEGTDHLRRRRMIQPVFHRALIDRYGDAMVAAAERTSARWRDGAVVDVNADDDRAGARYRRPHDLRCRRGVGGARDPPGIGGGDAGVPPVPAAGRRADVAAAAAGDAPVQRRPWRFRPHDPGPDPRAVRGRRPPPRPDRPPAGAEVGRRRPGAVRRGDP